MCVTVHKSHNPAQAGRAHNSLKHRYVLCVSEQNTPWHAWASRLG